MVTGAVMGMVKGSVFPGAGNVAGALIGATLAGFGVFGSVRVSAKEHVKQALRDRVADMKRDLTELTRTIVQGNSRRAQDTVRTLTDAVAELERQLANCEQGQAASDAAICGLDRHLAALSELQRRIARFCEDADLVRPPPLLAMIPARGESPLGRDLPTTSVATARA